MNLPQALSLLRQVMAILGGIAIARGYLDAGTLSQFTDATVQAVNVGATFIGAVMALGSLVWGWWSHTHDAARKEAVAAVKADPSVEGNRQLMGALVNAGADVRAAEMPKTKADVAELTTIGVR